MKKLSLVTVTYNDYANLFLTFESIRKEKNSVDFEYIVIDGQSTDNSIELIGKNDDIVNVFLSEKDDGIYDAMNKGLRRASGEFVLFLNAGDTIYSLKKIMADINDLAISEREILLYASRFTWDNSMTKVIMPQLSFCSMPTSHQAMIFPTEVAKLFEYDLSYKFSSDYDLYLKILNERNFIPRLYNDIIVKTAPVGFTQTAIGDYLNECYAINLKYNNNILCFLRYLLERTKMEIKIIINKYLPQSAVVYLRKLRSGVNNF